MALLGRSNVGKSSLINALTRRRGLARTSKTPGKTRACNVFDIGGRYYLVDLPGYSFARASHVERAGFARLLEAYLSRRESVTGVVWLVDARRDPSALDLELGERLEGSGIPTLVAITKVDKLKRSERLPRVRTILGGLKVPEDQYALTSAKTGEGIDDLRDAIFGFAVQRTGEH